ncbi:hypothetical protein CEXT_496281 [Caerostris extrusa]|uniref:Uncharacterized protein n=1 Tax=Caerostris extrusa TaxID=172846 RepID=A0AAV4RDC1_CAEEX|nr:hypothetical protein CEXT_496281 [Caerostris extrusa]
MPKPSRSKSQRNTRGAIWWTLSSPGTKNSTTHQGKPESKANTRAHGCPRKFFFSTFGIKTSDLEETKPTPPKETAPPTDQVDNDIRKSALDMAIKSRRALDKLEKAEPSSESAATLKGHLTFFTDNYKSNLRVVLKDNTIYPTHHRNYKPSSTQKT